MTSKEKKEILLEFSQIEGRIKELESELESLWSRAVNASVNMDAMPKGNASGTKTEISVEMIERQIKKIDEERDELEARKYDIICAINELPSIIERRVLHLKYIGKATGQYYTRLPLWKIANELGYSVDRINHIHGDALKHIKISKS